SRSLRSGCRADALPRPDEASRRAASVDRFGLGLGAVLRDMEEAGHGALRPVRGERRREGAPVPGVSALARRQPDPKNRAASRIFGDLDRSSVRVDDLLGDGKAEARSVRIARAGVLESYEPLEDAGAVRGAESRAGAR